MSDQTQTKQVWRPGLTFQVTVNAAEFDATRERAVQPTDTENPYIAEQRRAAEQAERDAMAAAEKAEREQREADEAKAAAEKAKHEAEAAKHAGRTPSTGAAQEPQGTDGKASDAKKK